MGLYNESQHLLKRQLNKYSVFVQLMHQTDGENVEIDQKLDIKHNGQNDRLGKMMKILSPIWMIFGLSIP